MNICDTFEIPVGLQIPKVSQNFCEKNEMKKVQKKSIKKTVHFSPKIFVHRFKTGADKASQQEKRIFPENNELSKVYWNKLYSSCPDESKIVAEEDYFVKNDPRNPDPIPSTSVSKRKYFDITYPDSICHSRTPTPPRTPSPDQKWGEIFSSSESESEGGESLDWVGKM